MNIFVSSLSFNTKDEGLRQLFTAYGNVTSAKVIIDKLTNRSKGFGFVEMPNKEEAENAIKQLNGSTADGRTIAVSEARPREERGGGGDNRSYNKNRW